MHFNLNSGDSEEQRWLEHWQSRKGPRQESITMTVTFFVMTVDPLTSQCKGTFLSPTYIYVLNMKTVRWKLLKLLCQNQSVDKVPLWPWPLTSKCKGIFLLSTCIYVWNMEAVRWKLLKSLCQNQRVDKIPLWPWHLTFWSQDIGIFLKMLTKFRSDLDLWPFEPKIYRYLPLAILHLCMKYESYTLKTTEVIVSTPKCWQSSAVTLTFDLLTPKCTGIFLSPSCIYVWNMKAVRWKLSKLLRQNQSSVVILTIDLLNLKCICILPLPSCIYNPINTATFAYLSILTHVYIYLGGQVLSYERNCSYANPAHVSKFVHGQDYVQIYFSLYAVAKYLLLCVNLVVWTRSKFTCVCISLCEPHKFVFQTMLRSGMIFAGTL